MSGAQAVSEARMNIACIVLTGGCMLNSYA
jgi:hypothetical protein